MLRTLLGILALIWTCSGIATAAPQLSKQVPENSVDDIPSPRLAFNVRQLNVSLAILWEGKDLLQHNLSAISEIRKQSDMDLIHFIHPAYFLRNNHPQRSAEKINNVLKPSDIIGLNLSAWNSLISKSTVNFRKNPNFWNLDGETSVCVGSDCGYDVPLAAYSDDELRLIFDLAVTTLRKVGFTPQRHYHTAGLHSWQNIRGVAREFGFQFDHSEAPIGAINRALGSTPILKWRQSDMKSYISTLKPKNQPNPSPLKQITHIPIGLYSSDQVISTLQALTTTPSSDHRALELMIMVPQESAFKYKSRLLRTLKSIATWTKAEGMQLNISPIKFASEPKKSHANESQHKFPQTRF
jgi:hypothetical protein